MFHFQDLAVQKEWFFLDCLNLKNSPYLQFLELTDLEGEGIMIPPNIGNYWPVSIIYTLVTTGQSA